MYYSRPDQYCNCGVLISSCPFWKEVFQELRLPDRADIHTVFPTNTIRSRLFPASYGGLLLWAPFLFKLWKHVPQSLAQRNVEILQNHWRLIKAVNKISQCNVIVDKSMSASRLLELYHTLPESVHLKVIHLIRDGRANMNSMKRITQHNVSHLARQWKKVNSNINMVKSKIPQEDVYNLRYEDLCYQPAEKLQDICRFIGVKYSESMLQLQSGIQHGIGGNPMRFRGDGAISLDERWKSQLTQQDLAIFEKIAGRMNRSSDYF
jgi:hypothetical protein